MVRAGRDFTDRETDFLATVAPAIASATRLALRSEASGSTPTGHPAIVVIGSRGELRALTRAGQEWRDRLDQIAPGRFMVMMQVMAVGARAASSDAFRARLRDARGQWAILEASPLIGGDEDQIAVSIEPASGDQLISLALRGVRPDSAGTRGFRRSHRRAFNVRYRGPPLHLQQHCARSSEVGVRQGWRTKPWRTRRSVTTEWLDAGVAQLVM
jgi:hypothetical protein